MEVDKIMAKILMLYCQPIIDSNNPNAMVCYYESLSKELIDNGNDVFAINMILYKRYYEATFNKNTKSANEIIAKIKKFNPDIIIAFNNQIVEDIILATNCPILLAEADDVSRFSGRGLVNKYLDRYYMVSFSPGFEWVRYVDLGFTKDKIIFLHMATSIQREDIPKDKNISFIGSLFHYQYDAGLVQKLTSNVDFYNDLVNYYKAPYENYDKFVEKYISMFDNNILLLQQFMDLRVNTLCSVADLGLNLYGMNFDKLSPELFLLRAAFNKEPKYSLQHNQDIYNSSKVNLSISHVQCKGYGFPWRVYDIMASGGLLISSYSKLLADQTADMVDIPMYTSPNDAHDLCKYALENPSYCEDIVAKSNAFVEKYGRWKSNFEILESKIGIKLINTKNKLSKVIVFESQVPTKPNALKDKTIKRTKTFIYSLYMALVQLPILYRLVKNKKKLQDKIQRYCN